ncbi:zinc finger MYM-type protein 1-like [Macrobrachium rosenbergii]|uniref:zinc finger MYM-type protein 1-like n=1 Tax=Macrobrachium rosenbergii TaxID=79674 RepID=UPI0034D61CA0
MLVTAFHGDGLGRRPFIDIGSKKWKDISTLLKQHQASERHINCMVAWSNFKGIQSGSTQSVASSLSSVRQQEIEENREHVKLLLKVAALLGRQGLSFHGHKEGDNALNSGNFIETLELIAGSNPSLKKKLDRRCGHYTSPQYQNDLISEQLAILVRYFSEGVVKERVIGTYHMENVDAASLADFIYKEIEQSGLIWSNYVAQCYDGASVLSGCFSGVQARLRDKIPQAVYIHCHAHRLNLVLGGCVKNISGLSSFFSVINTLYTFITNSNTRYQLFIEAQKAEDLQILTLERPAITRWSYYYRSVAKVKLRYGSLLAVLYKVEESSDSEAAAEASGPYKHLLSFKFVVNLHVAEQVMRVTNSLSDQLQSTIKELQVLRTDEGFSDIFDKAKIFSAAYEVDTNLKDSSQVGRPKRIQKISSKLKYFLNGSTVGISEDNTSLAPEVLFKRIYFDILDRFLSEMDSRFTHNMPLIAAMNALECNFNDFLNDKKLSAIVEFYKDIHIDEILLNAQNSVAKSHFLTKNEKPTNLFELYDELKPLDCAYSEILKIVKILITIPVTTASNERLFSVLSLVKTYLRTTVKNERLNDLLLMASEKELAKNLNYDILVNNFAKLRSRRYPLMQ